MIKKCEEADERGSRHSLDLQSRLSIQLNQQTSQAEVASVQSFAS